MNQKNCKNCYYYHGQEGIHCANYPFGISEKFCQDWQKVKIREKIKNIFKSLIYTLENRYGFVYPLIISLIITILLHHIPREEIVNKRTEIEGELYLISDCLDKAYIADSLDLNSKFSEFGKAPVSAKTLKLNLQSIHNCTNSNLINYQSPTWQKVWYVLDNLPSHAVVPMPIKEVLGDEISNIVIDLDQRKILEKDSDSIQYFLLTISQVIKIAIILHIILLFSSFVVFVLL